MQKIFGKEQNLLHEENYRQLHVIPFTEVEPQCRRVSVKMVAAGPGKPGGGVAALLPLDVVARTVSGVCSIPIIDKHVC